MKLAEAKGGDRSAIKIIPIKLVGHDTTMKVGLKVLSVDERLDALVDAKEDAKGRGVSAWRENDPVCSLSLFVSTVAASAVDSDSDPSDPEPWTSAEDLRASKLVGQENIVLLYEAQELHEQSHTVSFKTLDMAEFLKTTTALAAGDESPLDGMRAGTLRVYLLTIARMYVSLLTTKSQSTQAEASPGIGSPTLDEKPSP